MSAVVATVLIILLTVAVITIIWAAVIPMIQNSIGASTACMNADISIDASSGYTCFDSDDKIVGVDFQVNIDGDTTTFKRDVNLGKNEAKTVYLFYGNSEKTCDSTNVIDLPSVTCDVSSGLAKEYAGV